MERMMIRVADGSASPEASAAAALWLHLLTRLRAVSAEERGMTTETVIITAGLSALAVAVVAIIVSRVTQRANTIQ